MDRDGHSPAPGLLGEPDVIGVTVGQDEGPDVSERAVNRCELGLEIRPRAGQAGVDDRDRSLVHQEVRVDETRAQAWMPSAICMGFDCRVFDRLVPRSANGHRHGGRHRNARRNRRSLGVPVNTSTNRIARCSRPLRARPTIGDRPGHVQRLIHEIRDRGPAGGRVIHTLPTNVAPGGTGPATMRPC